MYFEPHRNNNSKKKHSRISHIGVIVKLHQTAHVHCSAPIGANNNNNHIFPTVNNAHFK